ncbi:hypothetical protein Taro_038848 [Colocasia esculenta]|uniref:Uncharacterized protein n=1 Tax=Colocasia esculenta TaxID=4460 RepID=A0A843W956_COLES|nr:hypothetical protein [Colocasia esculenta]
MVRRAQLLEDAIEFTDRIKGRIVKKELTSGAPSKPAYGKKRPLTITDGPSQEWKPKVPTTTIANNKPRCKHCEKLGHTTDECWRKAEDSPWEKGKRAIPPVIATARSAAISVGSCRTKASRQEHGGLRRRDSLRTGPDRPGPVSRLTALSRLESRRVSQIMTTLTRMGPTRRLKSDHSATSAI